MQFSILTYNILLNDARSSIQDLGEKCNPDVICIQELNTNNPHLDRVAGPNYRLAEYANCFVKFGTIFGGATYYNPKTLQYHSSKVINLPKSYYEMFNLVVHLFRFKTRNRTVVRTKFTHRQSGKEITVYNIHLSSHASNGARLRQLKKTLKEIDLEDTSATILAGDFNYPFGRKKLEKTMRFCGLSEATSNLLFTTDKRLTYYTFWERMGKRVLDFFVKRPFKLDYIFYRNCTPLETKRIDAPLSDHFPIFSSFTIKKEAEEKQPMLPSKEERASFFAEEDEDETDDED